MAKILLEFDSVEDRADWEIAAQANKMHSMLHDLSNELRAACKYQKPTKSDEKWRSRFNELLNEYGIELI